MSDRSRREVLQGAGSLERELLQQMWELLDRLPDDSEYRKVIERHWSVLKEAVDQIESLHEED